MKATDDLTEEQVLSLQNSRWKVCLCDFNAFCLSFLSIQHIQVWPNYHAPFKITWIITNVFIYLERSAFIYDAIHKAVYLIKGIIVIIIIIILDYIVWKSISTIK